MKGLKRRRESSVKTQKSKKRSPPKTTEISEDVSSMLSTSDKDKNMEDELQTEYSISAFSDSSGESDEEVNSKLPEEIAVESDDPNDISEAEEDEDEEICDKPTEDDEEEELEDTDPFIKHLKYSLHPELLKSLESSTPSMSDKSETWPILRNVTISMPTCSEVAHTNSKKLSEDEIEYTTGGNPPKIQNLKEISPKDMYIKLQIAQNMNTANCASNESTDGRFMTEFQNELFSIMNNYQDLYCTKQTSNNTDSMRFVYCLHMINHTLKTRSKILRHNTKLKNKPDCDVPDEYRDQGFVRPKTLVLLPFKSSAFKVVSIMEKLLFGKAKKGSVMKKKRFLEEYQESAKIFPKLKPDEYKTIFSGNTQDDFTLGISVTRKALKLYSEFYSSDIIIASPLSLRRIIGAAGEKDRDYDFLSSIELLILDQADIFLMQSWHHILHIFNHSHLKLKEYRRTDFSRVRSWSIEGHARFYRQTLIFSSVNLPIIHSLFSNKCHNYAGKVFNYKYFTNGTITNVLGERQHNFYEFPVTTNVDIPKKRFECFMNDVFPTFQGQSMRQVLIYIPLYTDFIRLRNHFMKESVNFMVICEHSPSGKVAEARDLFCNRDVHFLSYTERFHFYNRITLKGIRHIVFYDSPTYPHYYNEMCNMMHNGHLPRTKKCDTNFTVTALYSAADYLKLAPIVGSRKAQNMIASERNIHHIFVQDL